MSGPLRAAPSGAGAPFKSRITNVAARERGGAPKLAKSGSTRREASATASQSVRPRARVRCCLCAPGFSGLAKRRRRHEARRVCAVGPRGRCCGPCGRKKQLARVDRRIMKARASRTGAVWASGEMGAGCRVRARAGALFSARRQWGERELRVEGWRSVHKESRATAGPSSPATQLAHWPLLELASGPVQPSLPLAIRVLSRH